MKNLEYYLNLKYDIIIQDRSENEEKLFIAFTRELNKDAFYGVGESPEEAIQSFNDVKVNMFEYLLDIGESIPEPRPIEDELPSGKFIIRTSPALHRQLIELAQENKQSLNSYVNEKLAKETILDEIEIKLEKFASTLQKSWLTKFEYSLNEDQSLTNKAEKRYTFAAA